MPENVSREKRYKTVTLRLLESELNAIRRAMKVAARIPAPSSRKPSLNSFVVKAAVKSAREMLGSPIQAKA